MRHITLLGTDLAGGGAQRILVYVAHYLIRRGHRVDIVLFNVEGEYLRDIPKEATVIDLHILCNIQAIFRLRRYIIEYKPHSILSFSVPAHVASMCNRLVRYRKTQHIIRVENMMSEIAKEMPFIKRWRMRVLYRFADRYICLTRAMAADTLRYFKVSANKMHIINNPLDIQAIEKKQSANITHSWMGEVSNIPVFVAVGRLAPQKDYLTLFRAIAIARNTQNIRLIILGQGNDRCGLEEYATRLGIEDVVWFAGFEDNPYAYMAKASAVVLSSRYEGFCNVIVETLACGTPVLSTNVPGVEEVLECGKYGVVTPIGDEQAMADAMLAIAAGAYNYKRDRLKKHAQKFALSQIMPQYEALL